MTKKGDDEDLGAIAQEALNGVENQEVLDGTDFTKIRFTGMGYNALEAEFKIGDEVDFLVRGRCLAVGEEAVKSDDTSIVRKVVRMDVISVVEKH